VATTLQHSSFKSTEKEVWILEKTTVVTSQYSSLKSSGELQITPSGIIKVINVKVLGYFSKDPNSKP
jgi:hypothetical protein